MRLIATCLLLALCSCGDDDGGDGIGPGDDAGAVADARGPSSDAAESGRACATGLEPGDPTALASPALDCPSRVCLHVQDAPPDLCTDDCEEAGDCVAGPENQCEGAFVCVPVVSVGPFACRTFCVCDSAVPEGGFPVACAR